MLPDEKVMCHHTGFDKSCFDMVTRCKCPKWVKLQGVNPNTGQEIEKYNCADHWLPLLMVENSLQQRQTGAAVESFRNEMVEANTRAGLIDKLPSALIGRQ